MAQLLQLSSLPGTDATPANDAVGAIVRIAGSITTSAQSTLLATQYNATAADATAPAQWAVGNRLAQIQTFDGSNVSTLWINTTTGLQVTHTVPNGSIAAVTAGTPIVNAATTYYTANTTGTGYTANDQIARSHVYNGTVVSTVWLNQTTGALITPAPTPAHLTAVTTAGGITELAQVYFTANTTNGTFYTAGDRIAQSPTFNGQTAVDRWYNLTQGTLLAAAPTPAHLTREVQQSTQDTFGTIAPVAVTAALTDVATFSTAQMSSAAVQFSVSGAVLTDFEISVRTSATAAWSPIANNASDYTAVDGPYLGSTENPIGLLGTSAIMRLSVAGFESIRIRASGAGATVSGDWRASTAAPFQVSPSSGSTTSSTSDATAANQATQITATALTNTRIGDLVDPAPTTDTASSGINGRLQRIAQNITSLIAFFLPPSRSVSLAYEASRVASAAPATFLGISGFNSGPDQWIQIHNAAALPANGAIPVEIYFALSGTYFAIGAELHGDRYGTGIVVCNSSTGPTKTLGAADCWFHVRYR